jgi:hypothetical protein
LPPLFAPPAVSFRINRTPCRNKVLCEIEGRREQQQVFGTFCFE